MRDFLWGVLAATSAVSGLFFLKFWRESRDRLFLSFAVAFFILALHWVVLSVTGANDETRHYIFIARLVAFLAIIAGIVDKNRQ